MKKTEIKNLEDKDLQLRYFLGGLLNMTDGGYCYYWNCDINCSCNIVPNDERLVAIKSFIKKYNLTNERFLKLSYNYLIGAIMKYKEEYSQLFLELDEILKPYKFIKSTKKEIPSNNLREKELENLVYNVNDSNSIIGIFIKKYNVTIEDFIILAKTFLNQNMFNLELSNQNDSFATEIKSIINHYNLSLTNEDIETAKKEYQKKQEISTLIINTKSMQKNYLELIKKILMKEPISTVELINDELKQLENLIVTLHKNGIPLEEIVNTLSNVLTEIKPKKNLVK